MTWFPNSPVLSPAIQWALELLAFLSTNKKLSKNTRHSAGTNFLELGQLMWLPVKHSLLSQTQVGWGQPARGQSDKDEEGVYQPDKEEGGASRPHKDEGGVPAGQTRNKQESMMDSM